MFSLLSLRWYATAKQPRLFTVLLPSAVPAQHKQSLCKLECISMVGLSLGSKEDLHHVVVNEIMLKLLVHAAAGGASGRSFQQQLASSLGPSWLCCWSRGDALFCILLCFALCCCALPCTILPCPALSCPALPAPNCPALPCPLLPSVKIRRHAHHFESRLCEGHQTTLEVASSLPPV